MPNVDAGAKAWELELAGRVGTAIQARRKQLNLTAQQLAERTKNLGYPISRVAISKIEGNMRAGKFDIAELVVLAEALQTSPLKLLFPDAPDHKVEALPGKPTTTLDAITRFIGDRELIWPGREIAALTVKLDQIDRAFRGAGIAGHGALTAAARKKEETE
jgi:transcriptional regulator with XRE-family HTH domain